MWKLLLLVLIFQIAYVESAPVDVDRAFGHGREYLYIYEGQLLIGLPHRSKEFTGIKILANVRLQFQVEDKVFAQLENIVIARFHDIWERPKEQLPMDIVLPISGPELDDFLEWLKKPIMVIYRSGLIIEVDSVPGEPIPSVNVKKAILSMFQITLHGETEDTVDWWSHRFYKVVENTITGECETAYEAKPLKTVALPKVDDADINVSDKKGDIPTTMYIKTKNMQECNCDLDTLEIPQGLIHQEGEAHSTESIVKATSVTTYIVAGTPTEFWIKSAVTDGQYLVAPLLTEIGPVTFTKQNLRLLNVSRWVPIDRRHSIMMTDVIEERIGGLQFELPPMAAVWGISATDELEKKPLVVDRAKMQLIGRMVSALVPEVGVEFDIEHAPELFMTLVEELKTLNELEWRELFDTWVIKTEDAAIELDKQASILLDAVPLVATDEALIVVFDMMKLGHIKIDVALRLLTGLPLMAPLKEEIVRELLSVCQAEPVIDQPLLRSSSLLALGAMVHKVCVKHAVCSEQTIKDIIEFLLPENLPEVSTEIQLIHLKALGNAGLPATLDTLIELAKNDVLAPDIRAQALYSLIKLTKNKVLAEKIRVKLLPLFVETTLDSEVRTASLVVLLNCDLTFPYFQLLALHTHDQQDPQVGAFVYSSLRTLASLRHPLFKKQAQMAKLVLPQAKPWPFAGLHMSKNLAMDIAIANDKLGILTSVGILGHQSLIPRSSAVQLDMIVMNRVVNAVQVGFRQQGLLPLLGKLVPGIAPKPLKKTAGTVPGIEGIAETLKLKAKKPEKPKLNLYMKLLGNEVLTAEVNEILLEKIVSYIGKIHTIETDLREPQKLTFQKALMLGGNLRKVVTEIGVPLTIDAKASAMILAELEGQLKADPPIFTEKGQINKIEKVEGSLNLVPSMAALIKGFMGADATVIKTGIAIETTLQTATPLKTKIVLDVPGKKLQEFTTLPGKEMKLINVKITPHVITTGAVKATKVLETVAPKHEIVRKVDSLPLNDLLDRDLEVAAMCTQMGTGPLPWRCDPLSGPVVVDAVLKPKSPVDLEIQTDILLESKTRADILGPEWRMHESECLSSDRSVQAVKVSVAKKNIPDQKWIDAVVNIDILDGKYKGLATTLSLAPLLTTEELKICMQGEMVQPNSLTEQPSIEHLDKEIKMWVHLKAGETCEANPIMVEVTIAKTEQQIIDEEERATLEDELCREDILSGKPYSIDCRKLALRRSRLNKILVEITGEKLIRKRNRRCLSSHNGGG
ncbi:vitellogenin-2-like [Ptychodera flava]|uniref:vitellogenin-2-like n=1 Tax=Ptychodera flava TaxID=63121 RepID=UPI00396A95FD